MEKDTEASTMWAHDEYRFYGQRPNEHVMLVRHQHLFIFVPSTVLALLTLIVPYVLLHFLHQPWLLFVAAGWLLLVVIYISRHWYSYRHTMSILTNERIVSVIQHGYFNAKISEAELSRIQDVSTDIKGVLQTAFGFGNVTIRTASESVLVLKDIDAPYEVQQAIVRAIKDAKD